jgi:uncharacterized YigZ family protein
MLPMHARTIARVQEAFVAGGTVLDVTSLDDLVTIRRSASAERTIKASRFLAHVRPCHDPATVRATVAAVRAGHGDVSHVCHAFKVGQAMGASDDGEPGGTAGRPMLEVVLRRSLDHVLVTCTRWYGGTPLGAGGLVRAYSGTAAMALDAAGMRRIVPTRSVRIEVGYADAEIVRRHLSEATEAPVDAAYGADVSLTTRWEAGVADTLAEQVVDRTSGRARVTLGPSEIAWPAARGAEAADVTT